MKGLEPPRLSAPDPKSGAATNYATSAACIALASTKIYDLFQKTSIYEQKNKIFFRQNEFQYLKPTTKASSTPIKKPTRFVYTNVCLY